jgi:Fe2+ or Zn2+ uptake regulation protein
MPLYIYHCRGCDLEEERLAGIDHDVLVCTECGEIMDRRENHEEAFQLYWAESGHKKDVGAA